MALAGIYSNMSYSSASRNLNPTGNAKSLQSTYINGTIGTLSAGTIVSVDSAGQILPVDITQDVSVDAIVGVVMIDSLTGASTQVIDVGRILNFTTAYIVGTALFIDPTGALTDVKPADGVGGFHVGMNCIFVGVIVQNESNPSLKDLKVLINKVGKL